MLQTEIIPLSNKSISGHWTFDQSENLVSILKSRQGFLFSKIIFHLIHIIGLIGFHQIVLKYYLAIEHSAFILWQAFLAVLSLNTYYRTDLTPPNPDTNTASNNIWHLWTCILDQVCSNFIDILFWIQKRSKDDTNSFSASLTSLRFLELVENIKV